MIRILLLSLILISSQAFSECESYVGSVTEGCFTQLKNEFQQQYPDVGFLLNWQDTSIAAVTVKDQITITGGFARSKELTVGGFLVVICHELGHALYRYNEGEADYYAARFCLPKYFQEILLSKKVLLNEAFKSFDSIHTKRKEKPRQNLIEYSKENPNKNSKKKIKQICNMQSKYTFDVCTLLLNFLGNAANFDRLRCESKLNAITGEDLESWAVFKNPPEFIHRCLLAIYEYPNFEISVLSEIYQSAKVLMLKPLSYTLKDQRVVKREHHMHNSPQCRLDTFISGFTFDSYPTCWTP